MRELRAAARAYDDFAEGMRVVEATFMPAGYLPDNPTARQLDDAVQAGKRNAHPAFFRTEETHP